MLQLLLSHRNTDDSAMLTTHAIAGGHLEMVQWLVEESGGTLPSRRCYVFAAKAGNLALLKYLRNLGVHWPRAEFVLAIADGAVSTGNVAIVEWLKTHDEFATAFSKEQMCYWAAQFGHLDMLKWLRAQHPPCPWKEQHVHIVAALYRHYNVFVWMCSQHPLWNNLGQTDRTILYTMFPRLTDLHYNIQVFIWFVEIFPFLCDTSGSVVQVNFPDCFEYVNVAVWKMVRARYPSYFSFLNWKAFTDENSDRIADDLHDWLVTIREI
jgi:hypothetical protein